MVKNIFLSHPHSEADLARTIAEWLERVFAGKVQVVHTSEPEHRIESGRMVTTGIVEYMRSAGIVLALITPASLNLPWIFYEMGAAHALGKVFVPCVAQGLTLRDLPAQAHEYNGVDLASWSDIPLLVGAIAQTLKLPAVTITDDALQQFARNAAIPHAAGA